MRISIPTQKKRARIEIIPLIDIIFFLLATFIMVSLSMVKNQGIAVNLPQSVTSLPENSKPAITITVTGENELYFNKTKISVDELATHLSQLKSEDPDSKILLNGDGKALFENAIFVLDKVRKMGFTKISIRTTGKQDS